MRWFRLGALLLVVLALSACDSGPEPGPQSATLRVLTGAVEVQSAGGSFAAASDGQTVASGDTVRTGADGRAAIEYHDGSVTRLDHETTFTLTGLEIRDDGSTLIHTEQFSGSTYHRIADLTESGSRFDVVTPTATAAVQGTVFAVIFEEDGSVTFAVLDGTVIVDAPDGPIEVLAGFMVTVHPDGTVEGPLSIPEWRLFEEWIFFNQCVLDGAGECALATLESIALDPTESSIASGEAQTYTVEAFAGDGTSLGDVTSGAVITGEGCVGATCSPAVAGEYEISASFAGRLATATLTVEAGELDELRITPEAVTVVAGVPHDFIVEGFDAEGNPLGPVPATLTISVGTCDATSCVSTVVGEHAINAFYEGHSASAAFEVLAGPLAYIALSPADATVTAGVAQAYSTIGYDAYGNSLGLVSASYSVNGGTCTGSTCLATGAGQHTVIAGFGGFTDTAVLTVLTGPAAQVTLVAVDQYSPPLTIDCTSVLFRATIRDSQGNIVDDDTSVVVFGSSGTGIPVFPGGGAVVATNGVAEITVTYGYPYGAANVRATLGSIVSNTIAIQVSYCIG